MDDKHVISVTVTVKDQKVHCHPEPVPVQKKRNVKLRFEMGTSTYEFVDQDAIVVADGDDQFPNPSHTSKDRRTATLMDVNSKKGDFKYTVSVQLVGGGGVIEHDPYIQNEP